VTASRVSKDLLSDLNAPAKQPQAVAGALLLIETPYTKPHNWPATACGQPHRGRKFKFCAHRAQREETTGCKIRARASSQNAKNSNSEPAYVVSSPIATGISFQGGAILRGVVPSSAGALLPSGLRAIRPSSPVASIEDAPTPRHLTPRYFLTSLTNNTHDLFVRETIWNEKSTATAATESHRLAGFDQPGFPCARPFAIRFSFP
jgi:hypothetical protein